MLERRLHGNGDQVRGSTGRQYSGAVGAYRIETARTMGDGTMTRIAINGLGRIGRAIFKQIIEDGALELVAVNDLAPPEDLAYLLKHDSVYGRYAHDVRAEDGHLVVNGRSCVALSEKTVEKLPWRDLAVNIVLECTGVFTKEAEPAPSTSSCPRRSAPGTCPPSCTASTAATARGSSRARAARRTASRP
jgi:glyceraldehyde 3-phosphate dehydrogenase